MKTQKRIIASFALSLFILSGFFGGINLASAQSATTSCNSRTLYGTVYPNGVATDAWFEWGPNTSLSYATPKQRFTSTSTFSEILSPLPEDTTFYWRSVAKDTNGNRVNGSVMSFRTDTCAPPAPAQPTVNLTADQTNLNYNSGTTIHWSSTNAQSCSASSGTNGWAGTRATSGNFSTGALTSTTTYIITCVNSNASASGTLVINVGSQQAPSPTVSITADNSSVPYNGNTTIRWSSTNATSCNASGIGNGWTGARPTAGSFPTGSLTTTTAYAITCSNSTGHASDSITVSVGSQQTPNASVSISANPTNVLYNGSSVVSWTSSNATNCSATNGSNGWGGSRALSGTFNTGALTTSTTFSITCSNSTSLDSSAVTISVASPQQTPGTMSGSLTPANASCLIGADQSTCNVNLSWSTVNPVATSVITKNPNLTVASGNSGSSSFVVNYPNTIFYLYNNGVLLDTNNSTANCVSGTAWNGNVCQVQNTNTGGGGGGNLASVNFTSDQYSVTSGNGATLNWNSSNTTGCIATSGTNNWIGTRNTSGSFYTGPLYTNTTFTINCYNNNSSMTRDVTIVVNNNNTNNNNNYPPPQYSPTYVPTYVPTPTYIPNFISNTTTTTPPTSVSTNTINRTVYVNNGTGEKSLVLLTIDGGSELIMSGERRGYTVRWQNVSTQTLTNVVLRVLFPASMNFEVASKGSFKKEDNTLTLDIGMLSPNEVGDMFIIANTKIGLQQEELVVVVANLVYTDRSNVQNDTLAYATHRVGNGVSMLGANALFGGTFLPESVLGWLLLLLLILIMIFLIRYIFTDMDRERVLMEPRF
jgi:hypothetical protein